jgi:hypothetical protein
MEAILGKLCIFVSFLLINCGFNENKGIQNGEKDFEEI